MGDDPWKGWFMEGGGVTDAADSAGAGVESDTRVLTSATSAQTEPADAARATSGTREVATYCRICEPQCGLIATVTEGRLTSVRGDREHAHSAGFSALRRRG
jgi:anaerobic selenocysteine-containing dehydrogenase